MGEGLVIPYLVAEEETQLIALLTKALNGDDVGNGLTPKQVPILGTILTAANGGGGIDGGPLTAEEKNNLIALLVKAGWSN